MKSKKGLKTKPVRKNKKRPSKKPQPRTYTDQDLKTLDKMRKIAGIDTLPPKAKPTESE